MSPEQQKIAIAEARGGFFENTESLERLTMRPALDDFPKLAWRPWPENEFEYEIKQIKTSKFTDLFWVRHDGILQYLSTLKNKGV